MARRELEEIARSNAEFAALAAEAHKTVITDEAAEARRLAEIEAREKEAEEARIQALDEADRKREKKFRVAMMRAIKRQEAEFTEVIHGGNIEKFKI